jgi:hypothetical protein
MCEMGISECDFQIQLNRVFLETSIHLDLNVQIKRFSAMEQFETKLNGMPF